jgi:hypothetical protein
MREQSGSGRFVHLSFLVFLVWGEDRERGAAVDVMPFLSWSRWPKAVERESGGNLWTRVGGSRGYKRERARRKVEREDEPKQRSR